MDLSKIKDAFGGWAGHLRPTSGERDSLKTSFWRSHMVIACIGAFALLAALVIFFWIQRSAIDLATNSGPMAQISNQLNGSLQESLAAMRGWVSVGDRQFVDQRNSVWREKLIPELGRLEALTYAHGAPSDVAAFDEARATLIQLKNWQWHIEDVANSLGNNPAQAYYDLNVLPLKADLESFMDTVVDLQKAKASDGGQRELSERIGSIQNSISQAFAAILLFLDKGTDSAEAVFVDVLAEANRGMAQVERAELTPLQREFFGNVEGELKAFERLSEELIRIRGGKIQDVASFWLTTEAIPRVEKSIVYLNHLSQLHDGRMKESAQAVIWVNRIIPVAFLLLIALLLLIATLISRRGATRLVAPIEQLVTASTRLGRGDLDYRIEIARRDEIGRLGEQFEAMRLSLKDSQEEIKQNEERIRAIVNTATDGIVSFDGSGMVLAFNAAAERIFGYPADEIVGGSIDRLQLREPEGRRDTPVRLVEAAAAHVNTRERELTATRKDGAHFPIEISIGNAVVGGVTLFTAMTRDISDRKAAQRQIRDKNEQLEREAWSRQGHVALSNAMRGEQHLHDLGRHILDFFCDFLEAQVASFYLIANDKIAWVTGFGISSAAAQKGHALVADAARRGKVIVIDDVGEEHHTIETGLMSLKPRSLLVMPIAWEGVANAAIVLGFLAKPSDERIFFATEARENIGIAVNAAKAKENQAKLLETTKQQAEDLILRQEELSASNEELTASQEELKQQSEELQASNEELEEKAEALEKQKSEVQAANRQLEIRKAEIEEKSADLERASQYKSEFLANMSHELRTPLNSLLILSQSLAENDEGNLTAEQIKEAQIINSGGRDLLNLINDILDLSKIEAGKMMVDEVWAEVGDLVADIQRQFHPVARERGLEFRVEMAAGTPTEFYSDDQKVKQILRNFLSNAFKFTKEGSVRLHVRGVEPNGVPHITFAVEDTGIGISEEKQRAVFEAFQQADGGTSREYGGTGLGLSISRELARLLGGRLELESRPGRGSTFSVVLPLRADAPRVSRDRKVVNMPHAERVPRPAAPPPSVEIRPFIPDDRDQLVEGKMIILVVEDDPAFAGILVDLVRKRGGQCIAAGDGESGIALARQFVPAGIILDLGLPDIPGQEVLEELKRDPVTGSIPVHVVSGDSDGSRAVSELAVGFWTKPAPREDLESILGEFERDHGRIYRVLVVEDDPANQTALKKLLAPQVDGPIREVDAASSGAEALRMMVENRYGCIILDLNLPDMSGLEVLKALPEREGAPPVIVYTGKELTVEENRALAELSSSVIIKGVSSADRLLEETMLFLHHVGGDPVNADSRVEPAVERVSFEGRTILLVDDDLRNTFSLSKVLRKAGLNVIIADNGQFALDRLEEDPGIELVLMDIMMPVMDGYEAMGRIRSSRKYRDLPIIALTAKAMAEDKEKCMRAGANDYLSKPIDLEKLLSAVRVWLPNEKKRTA